MNLMKSRLRVGLSFVFIFSMLWTLSSAWAQGIPALEISGFRGNYSIDHGSAYAEKWHLPQRSGASKVNFKVNKEESQFRFTDNSSEYVWEDVPEFLLELEEINWNQVNAMSGGSSLEATISSFFGRHPQHSLSLKGARLNCQGTSKSILHDVISSCLNKGHFGFGLLETSSQTNFQFGLYSLLSLEREDLRALTQSKLKLENLEFKINRGSFNLSVRAHLDLTLNLKANGKIKFQAGNGPTSGELELRIDKVKAGFLTVTGKVFDELDKINDPNIRVARPFVYITFP